jgi:hypothetical protein
MASCNEFTPTERGKLKTNSGGMFGLAPGTSHYYGYMYDGMLRTMNADSTFSDEYNQRVYWYDSLAHPLRPDSVKINGNPMSLAFANGDDLELEFANSQHIWSVYGSAGLPTFTDTIMSPQHFVLTLPVCNDSISKSSGFNIAFTSPNTDSVTIVLEADDMLNKLYDSTWSYSDRVTIRRVVANTGSYSITSSDLNAFHTGSAVSVYVYGYKSKIGFVGSEDYKMYSISACVTYIWLKS